MPVRKADGIQVAEYLFGVCETYALFCSSSADDVETFTTRDQGNVSVRIYPLKIFDWILTNDAISI